MGEIFRQEQPDGALPWTGERMVAGIGGAIEMEHLHRYFLARDLGRGRDVLDVASGEGYGSALLAQSAASVAGVEIDPAAVEHAARAYPRPNLRFLQGSATALPLADASVDLVVSFETLEHFLDHEQFLAEVRRVLRPGGRLLLSTPDAATYSGPHSAPNPFHVRELTEPQFAALLAGRFAHVAMLRQRVMVGSAILAGDAGGADGPMVYEQRGGAVFESHRRLPRAPYLLALASDAPAALPAASLFIQTDDPNAPATALQGELSRLQAVEAGAVQGIALLEEARADAGGLREEVARLNRDLAAAGTELARLGAVEEASRRQGEVLQRAAEALEASRPDGPMARELAALRAREAAASLRARQQVLVLARLQRRLSEALSRESPAGPGAEPTSAEERCRHLEAEAEALHARLEEAAREERRLHGEVERLQGEVERLREEAERHARAYDRASRMIIPVWARRLVPAPLRALNPARAPSGRRDDA